MVKKIITKKIAKKEAIKDETLEVESEVKPPFLGKRCQFCQSKLNPSYTDVVSLRRFLTDRAKIVPKARTFLCSKHQRFVTREIKYARHLALLPFTPQV